MTEMIHNILTSMSMSAAGASAQSKESAQSRADLSSPLELEINIRTNELWPFLFILTSLVCSVKAIFSLFFYPLSINRGRGTVAI